MDVIVEREGHEDAYVDAAGAATWGCLMQAVRRAVGVGAEWRGVVDGCAVCDEAEVVTPVRVVLQLGEAEAARRRLAAAGVDPDDADAVRAAVRRALHAADDAVLRRVVAAELFPMDVLLSAIDEGEDEACRRILRAGVTVGRDPSSILIGSLCDEYERAQCP
eukprot:TRINITY_DN1916_c0_g3_i1.p3 TRINITY_DN1916_c0_g3~~TRINITY_DN1916_c0_g3_i1.p3  ORF type:complete len:163 (+),score=64.57 TRINITY_DN1916_c0_g3_i1:82-570(+)